MGLMERLFGRRASEEPVKLKQAKTFQMLDGYVPAFHTWNGSIFESELIRAALEKLSFHMESVFQGWNLTGIEDTFEGMLREGRIRDADDNDLLKIHMMDAAQQIETGTSAHPRKKLVKLSKNAHVDGVAAILDAMCMRANHWAEMGKRLMNGGG